MNSAYLDFLDRLPSVLSRTVSAAVIRRQKERHFGQVVPIEDVARLFELVNSVVRLACICRMTTVGREERYCYGLSLAPGGGRMAEILRGLGADYPRARRRPAPSLTGSSAPGACLASRSASSAPSGAPAAGRFFWRPGFAMGAGSAARSARPGPCAWWSGAVIRRRGLG